MTRLRQACSLSARAAALIAAALALPVCVAAPPDATPEATKSAPAAGSYREIKWTDLIPKDWNPANYLPDRRLGFLGDMDPDAQVAFADMRLAWDNAPTVPAMDGAKVKIPGYLVPLEEVRGETKEFLLVPYFGACIHTPPPPANQIVYVRLASAVKGFRAMDTVWVTGQLSASRQTSYMGTSGYRIESGSVDQYVPPPR